MPIGTYSTTLLGARSPPRSGHKQSSICELTPPSVCVSFIYSQRGEQQGACGVKALYSVCIIRNSEMNRRSKSAMVRSASLEYTLRGEWESRCEGLSVAPQFFFASLPPCNTTGHTTGTHRPGVAVHAQNLAAPQCTTHLQQPLAKQQLLLSRRSLDLGM